MPSFIFIEAEIRKNAELTALADEFRLYANELMDMLDGRIPVVSRLKVILPVLETGEALGDLGIMWEIQNF